MGFFAFIFLLVIVIIVGRSLSDKYGTDGKSSYRTSSYTPRFSDDFDEDEDFDDYSDYETSAARGDRDYFGDDPARDYDSYYAQVADDAMMGDQDAIDEMCGEFGEGEW